MVSVIWCELSMCPRSARRESAAEDLYALYRGEIREYDLVSIIERKAHSISFLTPVSRFA